MTTHFATDQADSAWAQADNSAFDPWKYSLIFRALWMGGLIVLSMSIIRAQHSMLIGEIEAIFACISLIMAYCLRRKPQLTELLGNATIGLYWLLFLVIFVLAPYNKTRFVLFLLLAAFTLFLKGKKQGTWWTAAILASVVISHLLMHDSGYSNLDITTGVIHTLVLLTLFEFHEEMVRQQYAQLEKINQQYQATLQLQEANVALEMETEHLRHLNFHDHLTGLFNRKKIEEIFEYEKNQSTRYQEPFSLILVDVDHFKTINDQLGHETGDDILKTIAGLLQSRSRKTDVVARWGGDEFVILAVKTDMQQAHLLAESLRLGVAQANLKAHEDTPLTICIGIATVTPNDTLKTMLRRADNALYSAKKAGRNCIKSK